MKQKYKKENSPRIKSAINKLCKRCISYIEVYVSRYQIKIVSVPYSSQRFGEMLLILAYGADKYDVLNALCPGVQRKVITFARGDIRHRKSVLELFAMLLTIVIALAILSLRLAEPC